MVSYSRFVQRKSGAKIMDTDAITRLNVLWQPIYPYLAAWLVRWCPEKPRRILEVGPFSGGIGESLGAIFKDLEVVCLMHQKSVARIVGEQFARNLAMVVGSLEAMPLRASFDMIISRGAFFFLTPAIIKEAYRLLKPGACALLGGGYGPRTPEEEIRRIAEESKCLNYELGKKWISREGLEQMVKDSGMERCSEIVEEGGLWLLMKKGTDGGRP